MIYNYLKKQILLKSQTNNYKSLDLTNSFIYSITKFIYKFSNHVDWLDHWA